MTESEYKKEMGKLWINLFPLLWWDFCKFNGLDPEKDMDKYQSLKPQFNKFLGENYTQKNLLLDAQLIKEEGLF